MRKCSEIVNALVSARKDKFRLGSCETEYLISCAQEWDPQDVNGGHDMWRRALDYTDAHGADGDGKAFYLEELNDGVWLTIGFGTGGRSFDEQCEEIVAHVMRETYISSCSTGFKHWSALPKAKSVEEFDLKLSAMGI